MKTGLNNVLHLIAGYSIGSKILFNAVFISRYTGTRQKITSC